MLSPRVIAVQGVGYAPALLAVQGLQGLVQPQSSQAPAYYGGGLRGRESEADLRALVEAKWEVIEAARNAEVAAQQERDREALVAQAPVAVADPADPVADVVLASPLLPDLAQRARDARRRNDEADLLLMLSKL